ncbi:hypothetical protein V6Z11_D12G074700 [Gossypium hirsutum]
MIEHTLQQASTMFTSKTPHFLKVILQESLRDGILGIPRKFVRKYGNQLSSPVKLEVPSGAIWQVELAKTDERVRLQNGWREFAEHYSLELGSFVVFRYEGNDHFHVLIFDKSASETDYPHTSTEGNDVSRKSKEKSHLPCPLPQKKMRIDSSNQHEQNSKLEVLSSGTSPDAQRSVKTKAFSCVQRLAAIEKAHAVQIASAFESTENPVFMIVMQPSYVRGRMFIPSDFARKFLTVHKSNLTLCNSTGKTWNAKLYYPANKKPNAHLYGGWREFVEDNHLNVGDICVFELIKYTEILMKVQIYLGVKNASKACGQQSLGSIVSRVKNRILVSDAEPNCQQSPSSSRESKDLTDSHIKTLDDSPLDQKTEKKLTRSSVQDCKMTRTSLSGSIQAKGIKHEKGKSLNFQYSTEELGGGLKNSAKGDSGRKSGARRCLKPDPVYQKQRACTGGGVFRTSNPSFSVVIHPSHVGSCSTVHIPEEFGKRYLKKSGEMMLRVADGRSWNVEYERRGRSKGRKAVFGGKSWGQFAMDNELEVGDVCVFELMNENGNLLEVVIHRKLLLVEIN